MCQVLIMFFEILSALNIVKLKIKLIENNPNNK